MFKYIITEEERNKILNEVKTLNIQQYINDYNDFLMTLNVEKSESFRCIINDDNFKELVNTYFDKSIEGYKNDNSPIYLILKAGFQNFYNEKKRINDEFINRYNTINNNKTIKRLNQIRLTIEDIKNYSDPIEYKKFKLKVENTMNDLDNISNTYRLPKSKIVEIIYSPKARNSYSAFINCVEGMMKRISENTIILPESWTRGLVKIKGIILLNHDKTIKTQIQCGL